MPLLLGIEQLKVMIKREDKGSYRLDTSDSMTPSIVCQYIGIGNFLVTV